MNLNCTHDYSRIYCNYPFACAWPEFKHLILTYGSDDGYGGGVAVVVLKVGVQASLVIGYPLGHLGDPWSERAEHNAPSFVIRAKCPRENAATVGHVGWQNLS